ncbi:hypothetical protein F2Q69_00006465 [Brassica cretica]|uniref:Uncharacterized protein n=1 Tax=Brassica cretica TaxID=69181 RepID=A0A8S9P7Y1_BRACR|nr:hypothetical protein F2Q69_00006465 [Brassica cretica]
MDQRTEPSGDNRSLKDRAERSRDVVKRSVIHTAMNVEIKWRTWRFDCSIDVSTENIARGEIIGFDAVRVTPEKSERDNDHRSASDEDVV